MFIFKPFISTTFLIKIFLGTAINAIFVIKCNVFSRGIHIHKDSYKKWNIFFMKLSQNCKIRKSCKFFPIFDGLIFISHQKKFKLIDNSICLYIHNYTYRLRNIFHSSRIKDVMRGFFSYKLDSFHNWSFITQPTSVKFTCAA